MKAEGIQVQMAGTKAYHIQYNVLKNCPGFRAYGKKVIDKSLPFVRRP
jgi:hypothetical protein